MSLYEKIMSIYPDLVAQDFVTTVILQNDGNGKGDFIKEWNHPIFPKPTDEQLKGV